MAATRIAIVGDALLDVDVVGHAHRIAPDAPVPVVETVEEVVRAGGAGLAATLARRDGCEVHLVTGLSADASGARLEEELRAASITTLGLPMDGDTPVKRRVRSDGHTIVRLDSGGGRVTERRLTAQRRSALAKLLDGADAVVVADYGRGVTSHPDVRSELARYAATRPLVWDPHPAGADPVEGTLVVTPNVREATLMTGIGGGDYGWGVAGRAARLLVEAGSARFAAVTLGELGVLVAGAMQPPSIVSTRPAQGDPCGAGDRFATRLAARLADGATLVEATRDAVECAALFVSCGGIAAQGQPPRPHVVAIDPEADGVASSIDLADQVHRSGGVVVAAGGCFDLLHAGHLSTLSAARSLGDCLIVCVNSDASVLSLKGAGRPITGLADRMSLLRELSCVDAVCSFDDPVPTALLRRIRPDIWVKGGDYDEREIPEAATLAQWGGQVMLVPTLPGHSTSALVRSVRTGGAA